MSELTRERLVVMIAGDLVEDEAGLIIGINRLSDGDDCRPLVAGEEGCDKCRKSCDSSWKGGINELREGT